MKIKGISAVLLMLVISTAQAERMLPISIQQLTQKADLVLHGSVRSRSVQRDGSGRIYTRIELDVAEAWKGRPRANPFVLVHSGGVLGEEIAMTDGQVELGIGEEVVLFLRLNERGEGVVIGMVQGKFKVARNAAGEKLVHNVFHGSPDEKADPAKRLTLPELKQRVQAGRP